MARTSRVPNKILTLALDHIQNIGLLRVASQQNIFPNANQGGFARSNSQTILVRINNQPQLIQVPPESILPMPHDTVRNIMNLQNNIQISIAKIWRKLESIIN